MGAARGFANATIPIAKVFDIQRKLAREPVSGRDVWMTQANFSDADFVCPRYTQLMRSIFHANKTVLALIANAVLLLLILVAISTRDGRLLSGSAALGQTVPGTGAQQPTNVLTIMPCQLSQYLWGCYMVDPQNQTLCVYEYLPNQELKLLAARDIEYDRKLGYFNTSPPVSDIKAMVERAEEPSRIAPTTMRSPEERFR
jgi:hypothetical protein